MKAVFFFVSLIAVRAQYNTPGPPLSSLPAATFCGMGIPNGAVATRTFVDGANTITLGLSAAARSPMPAVTFDAPTATFFAAPGPFTPIGPDPNLATWNFNYYVDARDGGGNGVVSAYDVQLLYDMDPNATPLPLFGSGVVNAATNPGCASASTIQNSQNLGFDFLRSTAAPALLTPPAGYAAPAGLDFNPAALGQYGFVLRVSRAGVFIGQVAINVSTQGRRLPNPEYSYQIRYAANLADADAVVNITNDGANGAGLTPGTSASTTGALCANVYVFSPDEQMVSCCSCPVTPNGLVSLSAQNDLISNTMTPAVPTSIVIKLVATSPSNGSCTNSAAQARPATLDRLPGELVPGMHAWGTTGKIRLRPEGGVVVQTTETAFLPATLNVTGGTGPFDIGELARLTGLCTMIQANGSGFGICRSCTLGGLGSGRR